MTAYTRDDQGQFITNAYGERIVAHTNEQMQRMVALAKRRHDQKQALLRKSATGFLPRAS